MINLEFDVSKISVLMNTVMMYQKTLEKAPEYSLENANSCNFIQFICDEDRLKEFLSEEELAVAKRCFMNKEFPCQGERRVSFFETLYKGYEVLTDANYHEVFERCLEEYKPYCESANELRHQLPILSSAINKLMTTTEFQQLYEETCQYKNELENNWNENKEKISHFIENVIGDKSVETTSKIMVLPPIFDEGHTSSIGDRDIYFSRCHDKKRGNHDIAELVCLTHESMHSQVLPYQQEQTKKTRQNLHGFIQYLCDNELYSMFCKEKNISYHYGENGIHGIDHKTFEKMYSFFIGYLYRNEENPMECIADNMRRNTLYSATIDEKGNYHPRYSSIAIANFFRGKTKMSPYEFANIDFDHDVKMLEVERAPKGEKQEEHDRENR